MAMKRIHLSDADFLQSNIFKKQYRHLLNHFYPSQDDLSFEKSLTKISKLLTHANCMGIFFEDSHDCIGLAALAKNPWDSRLLGRECGQLQEFYFSGSGSPSQFLKHILSTFKDHNLNYVVTRIPNNLVTSWPLIHSLEAHGFRTVDNITHFQLQQKKPSTTTGLQNGYTIQDVSESDISAVADLNVQSIFLSRFHNDPLLPKSAVDSLHAEWAKNCCLKQAADHVFVAKKGAEVVGFISGKMAHEGKTESPSSYGIVDLVAVSARHAGHGLGYALVHRMCDWFWNQKANLVQVQTQSNNLRAFQLYTRAGFSPFANSITLRWAAE